MGTDRPGGPGPSWLRGSPATGKASEAAEAVRRALDLAERTGVEGVSGARAALGRFVGRFRRPVDWRFSDLTGDGCPVELVFSSARSGFRYTVEAAGARASPVVRVASAASHLRAEEEEELLGWLGAWAGAPGPPRAETLWLGGRHDVEGDRFKAYVATDGWDEARRALPAEASVPPPRVPGTEARMVALAPATGDTEVYCRLDDAEPWQVEAEVGRLGWSSAASGLLETIEEATGRSVRRGLPATRVGFSWTFSRNGAPVAFSVFFFARSIFGPDRRIREGILRLTDRLEWDTSAYEAISRPVDARASRLTRHGMIGFTVTGDGPPGITIGLRPPPEDDARP